MPHPPIEVKLTWAAGWRSSRRAGTNLPPADTLPISYDSRSNIVYLERRRMPTLVTLTANLARTRQQLHCFEICLSVTGEKVEKVEDHWILPKLGSQYRNYWECKLGWGGRSVSFDIDVADILAHCPGQGRFQIHARVHFTANVRGRLSDMAHVYKMGRVEFERQKQLQGAPPLPGTSCSASIATAPRTPAPAGFNLYWARETQKPRPVTTPTGCIEYEVIGTLTCWFRNIYDGHNNLKNVSVRVTKLLGLNQEKVLFDTKENFGVHWERLTDRELQTKLPLRFPDLQSRYCVYASVHEYAYSTYSSRGWVPEKVDSRMIRHEYDFEEIEAETPTIRSMSAGGWRGRRRHRSVDDFSYPSMRDSAIGEMAEVMSLADDDTESQRSGTTYFSSRTQSLGRGRWR
ncbi:hypothetical protein QBC34DRAFT_378542 [Podospora aff. communis PSN243]|uniref:Arrestin-like N-terminal domain-containing protein n=1 Tax=Podospora aff. communis PSN243 TaxID=3040156 RepID=A0AAV9GT95_9PEZI|nr:hypothetical protein QBC34DRAFT_378542 [Podospora aff. communis PSN243]